MFLRFLLAAQLLTYPIAAIPCMACVAVSALTAEAGCGSCCQPEEAPVQTCCAEEGAAPGCECECCPIEPDDRPPAPLVPVRAGDTLRTLLACAAACDVCDTELALTGMGWAGVSVRPAAAAAQRQALLCIWLN